MLPRTIPPSLTASEEKNGYTIVRSQTISAPTAMGASSSSYFSVPSGYPPKDPENIDPSRPNGPLSSLSPPSRDVLLSLKALPSGSLTSEHRITRGRRRAKRSGRDRDLTLGNDSIVPWVRSQSELKVYTVSQELEPFNALVTSATVPTFAGRAFVLSDLDNLTGFFSVFDQYRIDMIEVLLVPQITEVVSLTDGGPGSFISTIDVDDASVPTTYGQLGGYANAQSSNASTQHYHRWVPQFAVAAYAGAFTSYSAATGWIDCGSPNVQHYGLKLAATAGNLQAIIAYTRYHVSFRALH